MAGRSGPVDKLESLLGDNISGSTEISRKVIDFYSTLSAEDSDLASRAFNRIMDSFAGMGLVRNVNAILHSSYEEDPGNVGRTAGTLREKIEKQFDASLSRARNTLPEGVVLCTLSNSSMVRDAIVRNRDLVESVFIMESRPLLEGQRVAQYLEEHGIESTVMVDAAVREIAEKSDQALVGCDSMLSDRSLVHKVGTYPLALAMKREGKPFFSITIEMKTENGYEQGNYPAFPKHDVREVSSMNRCVINRYFDITPYELLSGYISSSGLI